MNLLQVFIYLYRKCHWKYICRQSNRFQWHRHSKAEERLPRCHELYSRDHEQWREGGSNRGEQPGVPHEQPDCQLGGRTEPGAIQLALQDYCGSSCHFWCGVRLQNE